MSQYGAYGYALHGAGYQSDPGPLLPGHRAGHHRPAPDGPGPAGRRPGVVQRGRRVSGSRRAWHPGTTYTVKRRPAPADAHDRRGQDRRHLRGAAHGHRRDPPGAADARRPRRLPGLAAVLARRRQACRRSTRSASTTTSAESWPPRCRRAGPPPRSRPRPSPRAPTRSPTTVDGNGYDLYSDTRSQMYGGVSGGDPVDRRRRWRPPRGQIVTYDGKPVVTYFFASSGGHTESIQNVWAGATPEPWLRGVPDPYDDARPDPYHSWGSQMSLAAAAAQARAPGQGQPRRDRGDPARRLAADRAGRRSSAPAGTSTVDRRRSSRASSASDDTWATFTTITTTDPPGELSGTVFPAPAARLGDDPVSERRGVAHVGPAAVSAAGAYSAQVPPGRYRVGRRDASTGSRRHRAPERAAAAPDSLRGVSGPLLAIDGPFVLYRSFFALPGLHHRRRRPRRQRAAGRRQPDPADRRRPQAAGDRGLLRRRGRRLPHRALPRLPRRPPAGARRAGVAVRTRPRAVRRLRLADRVLRGPRGR